MASYEPGGGADAADPGVGGGAVVCVVPQPRSPRRSSSDGRRPRGDRDGHLQSASRS